MILLGFAFRQGKHWRSLSNYSWLTAFCAVPTFGLKGGAFYVFLLLALVWFEAVAIRLHQKSG
jgi:hypothetical protein